MKNVADVNRHLAESLAHVYLADAFAQACIDVEFNPKEDSLRERGRLIYVRNHLFAVAKQLEKCKKDVQSLMPAQ